MGTRLMSRRVLWRLLLLLLVVMLLLLVVLMWLLLLLVVVWLLVMRHWGRSTTRVSQKRGLASGILGWCSSPNAASPTTTPPPTTTTTTSEPPATAASPPTTTTTAATRPACSSASFPTVSLIFASLLEFRMYRTRMSTLRRKRCACYRYYYRILTMQ